MSINFFAKLYFHSNEKRACPDQHQYILFNKILTPVNPPQNIDYNFSSIPTINNILNNKRIVIILESPHVNEFKGLIGPAKGRTGTNFQKEFPRLLFASKNLKGKINVSINYDIILINADQYQCSNGNILTYKKGFYKQIKKNRIQRDLNWYLNFSKNADDLKMRIAALNPDILINLCTQGEFINLQNCVDLIITHSCYTKGTHPSSWRSNNGRID